ncbi:MAG TPA: alpha/beta hydrolase [Candidatus Binatia bacterium]|nr:alpha/beta hydrolase [Candidatus Binatia bacterium]
MRRRVALVLGVLAAAIALGWWSGSQPDRDAVEAARRELGIPLETRRVPVGDVTLFVVLGGPPDGPPVVLLHGFPEFWYAWSRPMALLAADGFRVAVPDQRGYGGSDKPRDVEAYRVDALADDVANLIAALGWPRAAVAGHDWGGAVAWALAIRHPERVRKLAIIDTPHPAALATPSDEATVSWYRTFFRIPGLPEWTSRLGNWFPVTKMLRDTALPGAFPEAKMDLYRSAWNHDGAYGTMIDWYRAAFRHPPPAPGDALRVHVPTLVLRAPDDAFMTADATRASLRWVDDGRLVELPRGSHWVLQEDPETVARELAAFFRP